MKATKKYTLREARERQNLSQADLAKKAEVSLGSVYSIESSGIYGTNEGTAKRLASALGLNVDQIHWPRGLSTKGRPPGQGPTPSKAQLPKNEEICDSCWLAHPSTWKEGDDCENC